ncbi:MAG: sialidase family protein [Patescibacteria group bacterium]
MNGAQAPADKKSRNALLYSVTFTFALFLTLGLLDTNFGVGNIHRVADRMAQLIAYGDQQVGYYTFDTGLMSSVGDAHFAVAEGVPSLTEGVKGRGIRLKPGDVIRASSDRLKLSYRHDVREVTIAFWAKIIEIDGGLIFRNTDTRDRGYRGFALIGNAASLEFWAGGIGEDLWLRCPFRNYRNEWHHITLTSRRNQVKQIFIDGEFCGQDRVGPKGLETTQNFFFGGPKFSGVIDELKIWKRILSPYEIAKEAQLEDKGMWQISIGGDNSPDGVYDASIVYDNAGTGWMVYTGADLPRYAHIKLAKSINNGLTWEYVKTLFSSYDTDKGVWRHEAPELVYDPTDPDHQWKLFWHKYLVAPPYQSKDQKFNFGWIAYSEASAPDSGWSEEGRYFGGGNLPQQPYNTKFYLSQTNPDLFGITYYSEPTGIVKDGVLYVAMIGNIVNDENTEKKVVLFKTEDHGAHWTYVSTLLDPHNDASQFKTNNFTAPSLEAEDGKYYLFVTPEDRSSPIPHKGLVIIPFENIATGKLTRDRYGNLLILKHMESDLSGGQSTYDERNGKWGIIMSRVNPGAQPAFGIYSTRQRIK